VHAPSCGQPITGCSSWSAPPALQGWAVAIRAIAAHNEESVMTQVLPAGSLAGKVALVTGSARGIGADPVRYFAGAGADVVINFRNRAPRAEKVANELRARGRRVLVVGADLTDPASVAGMFDQVRAEFGRLDVLV